MKLRIATFNIENLSSRWKFAEVSRAEVAAAMSLAEFAQPKEREVAERSMALTVEDDKRQMTALAIAETRADIIALQEVDSLRVLEAFFANYVHRLSDVRYGHFKLVAGNDQRGIDVAFAARRNLAHPDEISVKSYREASFEELGVYDHDLAEFGIKPHDRVFNRDCLVVTIPVHQKPLTLFITHLKSMSNGKGRGKGDGRTVTMALRRAESRAVRSIIKDYFGPDYHQAHWIIAGDLNDYRMRLRRSGVAEATLPSGIDTLFDQFAYNPVDELPEHERWTHYHRAWSHELEAIVEEHVQLDYLLVSPSLKDRVRDVSIIRRGLPYRVPLDPRTPDRSIATLASTGDRYPRVGWDRPKASDHCPLVIEIDFPTG
jgi:endonuclease/exonuclease/phosphatase family metal-dependent hydrolase